jgi:CelD/BcsL family acetyltransferase involved in cellulose biosynthesis
MTRNIRGAGQAVAAAELGAGDGPRSRGTGDGVRVHHLESLSAIEAACSSGGLLAGWDDLMAADPHATAFQTRGWCVTWYRCYDASFEPTLLVATSGTALIGIAPLARRREDGRLVFAGHDMCDYRDFVVHPGRHHDVLGAFVAAIAELAGAAPFTIGPTAPDSPTVSRVAAASARDARVRAFVHLHPCWRLSPVGEPVAAAMRGRKSIRQALARYAKSGGLTYERVTSRRGWDAIKDAFFAQHSLRQLHLGRAVSFQQPVKQRFFSQLFEEANAVTHFSVLKAGDRLVASHFGFLHRSTLALGAPAFDPRDERNSPGLLWLIALVSDCPRDGIREIDFTLGTEPYKARFGNRCLQVPIVDLYVGRKAAAMRSIRDGAVRVAKAVTRRTAVAEAWPRIAAVATRLRVEGWRQLLREGAVAAAGSLYEREATVEFLACRGAPRPAVPLAEALGTGAVMHEDELADLARVDGWPAARTALAVRRAVEGFERGERLFTLLCDGRLAGYGWLRSPALGASTGDGVVLSWHLVRRDRRAHAAIPHAVAFVLGRAFAAGAETVRVRCRVRDAAGRAALGALPLPVAATITSLRILGWRLERRRASPGEVGV